MPDTKGYTDDERTRRAMHGLVQFDKQLLERLKGIYDDLDCQWLNSQQVAGEFNRVYEAINNLHAELGLMKLAMYFVKRQIAQPNGADSQAAWVVLNRIIGGSADEIPPMAEALPKAIPAPQNGHTNGHANGHQIGPQGADVAPVGMAHSADGITVTSAVL